MLAGADILLLEDDSLLRRRLAAFLEGRGAAVTAATTLAEARRLAADLAFDLALLDLNLPDGSSLDLLRERALPPTTGIVVMTAEGGVSTAVEALRLGAGDYLAKPFDFDALPVAFARCRRDQQAERREGFRSAGARSAAADKATVAGGMTAPPAAVASAGGEFFFGAGLAAVQTRLDRIVAADRRIASGPPPPVLIEGETGTGKTTLARLLHAAGPRAGRPLVEVNCSALPESLAESELFGHERGAFTDAKTARMGLFEAADGGTLFLDEIPSLGAPVQAKILTVLESGRLRRVGGTKEIQVDVRIIAATNTDLAAEAAAGRFRPDLYHRLDLFRLRVPPLRERRADLPALAQHLLAGIARRYRLEAPPLSPRGLACLLSYAWPGNVRELAHELERSLVLHEGDDAAEGLDFPGLPGGGGASGSAGGSETRAADGTPDWLAPGWTFPAGFQLDDAIARWIDLALAQTGGNVSAAARLLGVTRDYIRYRRSTSGTP